MLPESFIGLFSLGFEGMMRLVSFDLTIPAWQLLLYAFLVSLFMLSRSVSMLLSTTYMFTLYWIYYLFGPAFVSVASENLLALTAYILFSICLAGSAAFAFFFYQD